jgi:asparagine synthase (glutamine-hydrolysing)
MCGIAGYLAPTPADQAPHGLRLMATRIAHRGPDGEGFFEAATADQRYRVGFAHRRLAIIDLDTGRQPMKNEDGTVWVVFNGEIYNFAELRDELIGLGHVFSTRSDTETLVHAWEAWGTDCVTRLAGMFAFALWDSRKQILFLARDRFGKKPLFIAQPAGALVFASEIKALNAWPGLSTELDENAVWGYFEYRYVPGPQTLWRGIRKLMPGHFLVWQAGVVQEHCYWMPPDGRRWVAGPLPADPVAGFREQLDRAVRLRMVSDVPFGAFLSGGIDSSSVVALMTRHSGLPIKTFSVGFAESAYSELRFANQVAKRYRTEHRELQISATQIVDHLPTLAWFRDAPVTEASDVPIYLLALEARKTVKMVLTGEGSDEVLAGYPKHSFERLAGAWMRAPRLIRRAIAAAIGALPQSFWRAHTVVSTLAIANFDERMPRWFGALSREECVPLLQALPQRLRPAAAAAAADPAASSLRRILYFDQTSWLPDNLLERGDRMTMAASVEGRMPFMDHALVDYVSALPDTYRMRGLTSKWILREAMRDLLPAFVVGRPKVGFKVPINLWFRGHLREYLNDCLAGPSSLTRHFYRADMLARILDEHQRGLRNHEKLLWCMLNLEVWLRVCRDPAPAGGSAQPGLHAPTALAESLS